MKDKLLGYWRMGLAVAAIFVAFMWDGADAYAEEVSERSEDLLQVEETLQTEEGIFLGEAIAFEGPEDAWSDEPFSLQDNELVGAATKYNVTVEGEQRQDVAFAILQLVNKERVDNGKAALMMDTSLLATAGQRSAELSIYYGPDHSRPDGTMCDTAFPSTRGYYGENIAFVASSASYTADELANIAMYGFDGAGGWMNSPGHRANILSDDYSAIGVGVFINNGMIWLSQNFGQKIYYGNEATSSDAVTKSYKIKVVSGRITLDTKESSVRVGESVLLTPMASQRLLTSTGQTRQYKTILSREGITFEDSSGDTVFSVTENGEVTGVKQGSGRCMLEIFDDTEMAAYGGSVGINVLAAFNVMDVFPRAVELEVNSGMNGYGTISLPSHTATLLDYTNQFCFTTGDEIAQSDVYQIFVAPLRENDCGIAQYISNITIMDTKGQTPEQVDSINETYSIARSYKLKANTKYYFSINGSLGSRWKVGVTNAIGTTSASTAPTLKLGKMTLAQAHSTQYFPNLEVSYAVGYPIQTVGANEFCYVILEPMVTGVYEYDFDGNFLGGGSASISAIGETNELIDTSTRYADKAVKVRLDSSKKYLLKYRHTGQYGSLVSFGLVKLSEGDNTSAGPGSGDGSNGSDSGSGTGDGNGTGNGSSTDNGSSNQQPTPPAKQVNPNSSVVTERFADVNEGVWYVSAVQYAVDNGIMSGIKGTDNFNPDGPCTREMMVTILYRAFGSPSVAGFSTAPFSDVAVGSWYDAPIRWAYATGLTTGIKGTSRFGVGDNVTREQLATFLVRFASMKGLDASTGTGHDISSYPDAGSVSGYAGSAIRWANYNGIITGKKLNGMQYLAPQESATRAEVAKMIMNFQGKFGK